MFLSTDETLNNSNPHEINSIQTKTESSSCLTCVSTPFTTRPSLLVVDDDSDSDQKTSDLDEISSNLSNGHIEKVDQFETKNNETFDRDESKDSPERIRRRNSSIAKLLGGQPLENQQYEEIHKKIIDNQTNQTLNNGNNDNSEEFHIPRSRSSITRNLLMNAERHINNPESIITHNETTPLAFSKDFEYLIRRELDIEHSPSTFCRNNSTPSVFQNLSSARHSSISNKSPANQPRLKRKRSITKLDTPQSTPTKMKMTRNTLSNTVSSVTRDPFELDKNYSPLNSNPKSITMSYNHPNSPFRLDTRMQTYDQTYYQSMSNLSMSDRMLNRPSRFINNDSVHSRMNFYHNRSPIISSTCLTPSTPSLPYGSLPYSMTFDLGISRPSSTFMSHLPSASHRLRLTTPTSKRMAKSLNNQADQPEDSLQQLQSAAFNQPTIESSSLSFSPISNHVPLKKRLLHAYEHERGPSSSL